MEPNNPEYNLFSQKKDCSKTKGKELKITPGKDFKKPKVTPRKISGDAITPKASGLVIGQSQKKIFPCSHCDRKFDTSQALGGHQNAHKDIRGSAKGKNIYPNPNIGYFPPNNPIPAIAMGNIYPLAIPSYFEPYYFQPNLESRDVDFYSYNNPPYFSTMNPHEVLAPSDARRNAYKIPDLNSEVYIDYAKDVKVGGSSSGGVMPYFTRDTNDAISKESGPKKGEESLDLSLKLN